MKRIIIAFVFLFVALCSASIEMGYIAAKADMFDTKINKVDKLIHRSEFDEAQKLCKQNEDDWYDSATLIDMLLIHDYVDSIGIRISRMRSFAESENRDMYFAESTAAKKELASVKESEYPYFENIL